MNPLLISICIPTYNGAKHLKECLDSVLGQTFGDFEVLLVDDGSSDNTLEIAREYAERDQRIQIKQNERNLGLVRNWNRCIELAKGEWIKFVFQDDFIAETCLEKLIKNTDLKTSIICCRRKFCFEQGVPDKLQKLYLKILTIDTLFPQKTKILPFEFCNVALDKYKVNFIGEPTNVMLHRNTFYRLGTFNPHFISLCDYEYWIRAAINGGLVYIPETLATFRVHSSGTTALDRASREYRMGILDPLLLLYEFNFNPLYEPIRAVAAGRKLAIDLINLLACETRAALRVALHSGKGKNDLHAKIMEEWKSLLQYYPAFQLFSTKLFIHSKTFKDMMKILKVKNKFGL